MSEVQGIREFNKERQAALKKTQVEIEGFSQQEYERWRWIATQRAKKAKPKPLKVEKTKRMTKMVKVTYWSCPWPEHTHQVANAAQNCIEKMKRMETAKVRLVWSRENMALVLEKFRAGAKKAEIARAVGVSSARIAQIIARAEFQESRNIQGDPLDALSVRARNCLLGRNIQTVEEAMAAFESGELRKVSNLGAVTLREVGLLLGKLKPHGGDH